MGALTGSIVLAVQALDNNSNSMLFNKAIQGLLSSSVAQADMDQRQIVSTPSNIFTNNRLGLYIKNLAASGQTDVITVSWTPNGGTQVAVVALGAQGVILVFNPAGDTIGSVNLVSSNGSGTQVEIAWWL